MSVSNKKKKSIIREYPGKSIKELSAKHGLSPRDVRSVLREAGKLSPASRRPLLIIGVSLIIATGLAATAYVLVTKPGPAKLKSLRNRLNVLVVTIDTCRADRIGCYGYGQAHTPVIDSLAEGGVMFESAYAIQPVTLPSHATIFTGTHPAYHGVADNGLFMLADQATTLAESLKPEDYATGAVIASFVLHGKFGLNQGFDYYNDTLTGRRRQDSAGFEEIQASSVSDVAVAWIAKNADRKWMLWLHYYDPHADYLPPPEFRQLVPTTYDGEIAYVDAELGRVIDALDQTGVRDRTLVIVTADHGESLGEHGELTHANFLYEAPMRVPLIFSLPGALPRGRVVANLVSLMDLMPTVLDALGIGIPESVQGVSILPLLFSIPGDWDNRPVAMETEAPWFQHGWSPSFAIIDKGYKYIKAPRPELFDLSNDPRELTNLYAGQKGRAEAMARDLMRIRREYAASSIASLSRTRMDEETRQKLASLGYVFTGGSGREPSREAPDAKDRVHVIRMTSEATALKKAGKLNEAIDLLERVAREDPGNRRALNRLGTWHGQADNFEKAERYLNQLLKLDPEFTEAYINLGNVYADTGRFDEARLMARAVLDKDPDSAKAYSLLGMTRYKQKDYQGAIKFYRRAIELFPAFHEAHSNLGAAYYHLGDKENALKALKSAIAIVPDNQQYRKYLEILTRED